MKKSVKANNLYVVESLGRPIKIGELLTAVAVSSASVVRDVQQGLKNLMGGPLEHYEKLTELAVESAFEKLDTKAKQRGYDGVIGVRLSHPAVVEGGVEVVAIGNGFHYCPYSGQKDDES